MLRKENSKLQNTVNELGNQQAASIEDIADIDSEFTIDGSYTVWRKSSSSQYSFKSTITWRDLFALISPYLVEHPNDGIVKRKLAYSLLEREGKSGTSVSINDQAFKTVTIQLEAYGLITTSYNKTTKGGMALFWKLTKKGKQLMIESRVVK
ncbi:hypothetical protein [Idiomarina zobellii]|uniref:hypothetical protein n=1 Tax=Idiomarina zobellii TaxID=86103 RepID=UPI00115FFE8B|nr:hypothetical protein [Idiomarina zobellii]